MKYDKNWCEAVTKALYDIGIVPLTEHYISFTCIGKQKYTGETYTRLLNSECSDYSLIRKIEKLEEEVKRSEAIVKSYSEKLSMLEKYLNIEYVEEIKKSEFEGYRKIKKVVKNV